MECVRVCIYFCYNLLMKYLPLKMKDKAAVVKKKEPSRHLLFHFHKERMVYNCSGKVNKCPDEPQWSGVQASNL